MIDLFFRPFCFGVFSSAKTSVDASLLSVAERPHRIFNETSMADSANAGFFARESAAKERM